MVAAVETFSDRRSRNDNFRFLLCRFGYETETESGEVSRGSLWGFKYDSNSGSSNLHYCQKLSPRHTETTPEVKKTPNCSGPGSIPLNPSVVLTGMTCSIELYGSSDVPITEQVIYGAGIMYIKPQVINFNSLKFRMKDGLTIGRKVNHSALQTG